MANNYGDPVWLADVLKKAGLKVQVLDGALQRGHGDFGLIKGMFVHHTGASGSPGPWAIAQHPQLGLCSQLHLARNGLFTVCGVGKAWHAGTGSWSWLPANQGNDYSIGIEAENNGTEGWSDAQYNAYVKGVAACNRHMGYGSDRVVAHKEYGAIQGKWDPGLIDMNKFRREVQAVINNSNVPVVNEIDECAKKNPWLGKRITQGEEVVGVDKKGRAAKFELGTIYWSAGTGAIAIPGADPAIPNSGLSKAFDKFGGLAKIGYPVRPFAFIETATARGVVQAFQNGIIYIRNGEEPTLVGGVIGQRWALEGYEKGELGWPTTSELDNGSGGKVQHFEFGTLSWDPSGAVKKIGDAATNLAIVNSAGFPLATDEVKVIAA